MIKEWQEKCLMGQTSSTIQPKKVQLERRKEGEIKGGVSPQRKGIQKTEKKKKREREKNTLCNSLNFMFCTLGRDFFSILFIYFIYLDFQQLLNLPIVDYSFPLYKLVVLIKNLRFVYTILCLDKVELQNQLQPKVTTLLN